MEHGNVISSDEFAKVDIRVGEVKEAVALENSEKLLRFTVNFGNVERNILAGLKPNLPAESFVGRNFIFILNLAPRKMAGEVSQGMILCADTSGGPKPVVAPAGSKPGDEIR